MNFSCNWLVKRIKSLCLYKPENLKYMYHTNTGLPLGKVFSTTIKYSPHFQWTRMVSCLLVYQTFDRLHQTKLRSPRNWCFVKEIHWYGDWWIPLTKGKLFGKRFHFMTSLCLGDSWSMRLGRKEMCEREAIQTHCCKCSYHNCICFADIRMSVSVVHVYVTVLSLHNMFITCSKPDSCSACVVTALYTRMWNDIKTKLLP